MNQLLERLRSQEMERRRTDDLAYAWDLIGDQFLNTKPRRFISGLAISSKGRNAHGDSFIAQGLNITLPTVLLWNHDWLRPLGRVTGIHKQDDQVVFTAEFVNGSGLSWTEMVWDAILDQRAACASVGIRPCEGQIVDRTFTDWALDEISITEVGADHGAVLCRAWEVQPFLYIDDRPSSTIHWER